MNSSDSKAAFTLVELAIVIVIIGLLVAGVMQGAALIEQAKIKAIITDLNRYRAAALTYFGKYNAYAGDHNKASVFFSGAVDGDGNQVVDTDERDDFWNHLSRSKIIAETYVIGDYWDFGTVAPKSRYGDGAGYVVGHPASIPNYGRWAHFISITKVNYDALFTPEMGKQIDEKLDDGIASSGLFHGQSGNNISGVANFCTTWDGTVVTRDYNMPAGSIDYRLTNSKIACRLAYIIY